MRRQGGVGNWDRCDSAGKIAPGLNASRLPRLAEARRLADAPRQFVEPFGLVQAMDYPAEKSKLLRDVVPVGQNALTRGLGVLPHELLEARGLLKDVGCMASLGNLDHHGLLQIKNVFFPEQV